MDVSKGGHLASFVDKVEEVRHAAAERCQGVEYCSRVGAKHGIEWVVGSGCLVIEQLLA